MFYFLCILYFFYRCINIDNSLTLLCPYVYRHFCDYILSKKGFVYKLIIVHDKNKNYLS